MNNLNSRFVGDEDHDPPAEDRSLITIVNDDINDGRVKLSECKVAIFNLCPIIPGKYVRLNDSVACLLRNAYVWDVEGTCAILFDSIVKNIVEVCSADSSELCANVATPADQPDYYEPLARLTCYGQHYFAESVACQSYLDQLIINVIPCASEAGEYCSDVSSNEKMICLNNKLSDKDITDFTAGCKSLIGTWSAEQKSTFNHLLSKPKIFRDEYVSNYVLSDDDASIAWSQAVKGEHHYTLRSHYHTRLPSIIFVSRIRIWSKFDQMRSSTVSP